MPRAGRLKPAPLLSNRVKVLFPEDCWQGFSPSTKGGAVESPDITATGYYSSTAPPNQGRRSEPDDPLCSRGSGDIVRVRDLCNFSEISDDRLESAAAAQRCETYRVSRAVRGISDLVVCRLRSPFRKAMAKRASRANRIVESHRDGGAS